jgi:hypothetical protein
VGWTYEVGRESGRVLREERDQEEVFGGDLDLCSGKDAFTADQLPGLAERGLWGKKYLEGLDLDVFVGEVQARGNDDVGDSGLGTAEVGSGSPGPESGGGAGG